MEPINALEIRGLTKHYKGFTLDDLDLTLPIRVKEGGRVCEYCDATIEA